jgi:catechol-2,3-dioxygenase
MSPPAKLAHVVLYTEQLEQMRAWYLRVLDAHVVHENPSMVFLTYDDEHHRIAIANLRESMEGYDYESAGALPQTPREPSRAPVNDGPLAALAGPPVGLGRIAFTFNSLDELLDNFNRLRREGVVPVLTINHGTTTSLYYKDPDGNKIELQIDNFDTVAEGTEFIESESFAKNPIGVLFDPDELIERRLAGETQSEIVIPSW